MKQPQMTKNHGGGKAEGKIARTGNRSGLGLSLAADDKITKQRRSS
jgi:hypothetical protein